MTKALMTCLKDEKGQGMTEYILIVTLVALAAIAAFVFFRQALKDKINFAAASITTA
jgi:Flp pilus assembly pilin Flp